MYEMSFKVKKLSYMIILVDSMVHDRKKPRGPLKSVGTTWLKIEGAQTPVLQLTNKIFRTNTFCQMELALPVETKDVLEYSWRPVEVKLSADETEGVAQSQDLS